MTEITTISDTPQDKMLAFVAMTLKDFSGGSIALIKGQTDDPNPMIVTAEKAKLLTNSDPVPYTFIGPNGAPLILLSEYGNNPPCSTVIPTIEGTWIKQPVTWSALSNVYAVEDFPEYIFAIDFDNATVAKIRKSDNVQVATYTLSVAGFQVNGVALAKVGNLLVALFIVVDDPWATTPQYQSSRVVFLDPNSASSTIPVVPMPIGPSQSVLFFEVGKNASCMSSIQNSEEGSQQLFITSIGGKQKLDEGNGANSRIESVTVFFDENGLPENATQKTHYHGNTKNNLDFHGITFRSDGEDVYFLVSNVVSYTAEGKMNVKWQVHRTTLEELNNETDTEFYNIADGSTHSILHNAGQFSQGYLWAVYYDNANGWLWLAHGDSIKIYDPSVGFQLSRYSFSQSDLNTDPDGNLNSITLCAESILSGRHAHLRGYQPYAVASRSKTWSEHCRSEFEKTK
jgi:hypothetical protein